MIDSQLHAQWLAGLRDGSIVPYIGAGVLADVKSKLNGQPMPATSDQLILALNNGQPMAPKLMYEFPRAAMNIELKRGRSTLTRFLDTTYGATQWTRASFHDWLAEIAPPYVIDINRDTQLIDSYAAKPHTLILGCARIGGTQYRFKLYSYDGSAYKAVEPEAVDPSLPILFKPMGAPKPEASYIASDADYVDYITELMGGFAVPSFVKEKRKGKRYLLIGMRLNRDSERMVLSDLIYDAGSEPAGWILVPEPNDKERRFCKRLGLEIIEATPAELVGNAEALAA